MTTYKSRDMQNIFDVSAETIRTWATEFDDFLSPTARPGKGKHRIFNEDDLAVFALVADYKNRGQSFDDIHLALHNGERGDINDVLSDRAGGVEITGKLAIAHHQLAQLQANYAAVLERSQQLHDQVIRLETELKLYKDQAQEIGSLREEIGRLKALLEVEQGKTRS